MIGTPLPAVIRHQISFRGDVRRRMHWHNVRVCMWNITSGKYERDALDPVNLLHTLRESLADSQHSRSQICWQVLKALNVSARHNLGVTGANWRNVEKSDDAFVLVEHNSIDIPRRNATEEALGRSGVYHPTSTENPSKVYAFDLSRLNAIGCGHGPTAIPASVHFKDRPRHGARIRFKHRTDAANW